jgi:hypothetical protein
MEKKKKQEEVIYRLKARVRDTGVLQTEDGELFGLHLPFLLEHLKEGRVVEIIVKEPSRD